MTFDARPGQPYSPMIPFLDANGAPVTGTTSGTKTMTVAGPGGTTVGSGTVTHRGGGLWGLDLAGTAAATVVGDTLDVYVDTSGTGGQAANDWLNIIHFPQVLGNGGAKTLVVPVNNMGATVTAPYDASADLAVNTTRAILYGDMLRVRYGTVGTGSFTFRVDVYTQ